MSESPTSGEGQQTPTELAPDELTTTWERGEPFPFVEDEDCNITGYGHQDKAAFAAEVNRYDQQCGGLIDEEDQWNADDISHKWAVLDVDGERFWIVRDGSPVTAETPSAFPITTLWNSR